MMSSSTDSSDDEDYIHAKEKYLLPIVPIMRLKKEKPNEGFG